jgi:hypothetical protein
MMLRGVLATAMLIVVCGTLAHAQMQHIPTPGYEMQPLGPDTLCFSYRFMPHDTVFYDIVANDSIWVQGEPRQVRERNERIMLICDSVTPGPTYHLRQSLQRATSVTEMEGDATPVKRATSPWIGRTAYLVVDSSGRRSRAWPDFPRRAAITPGGPFQPVVLLDLGGSCGRQNQSWIMTDTVLVTENGVPEPAFRYETLVRVLDKADTLGRHFVQLQYARTGAASAELVADGAVISMNGFGKLTLDTEWRLPYHLFATAEVKLTIQPGERSGKHLMSMHAQLTEIRSSVPLRRYRRP